MGAVQHVGNAYNGVTITATLPGSPTVGNTIVAIANSDSTLTIDGTWNLRKSFVSDQGFYVWDKVAGGSESPSVSVSPDGGADYAALVVVELDGVSDFDTVGTVGSHHGAASSVTAPSVASSADDDLALVIAALHGGWDSTGAPGSPSFDNGFTALESAVPVFAGSTGFVCAIFVGYQELGAAGDIGDSDVSWLVSTSANQAGLLVAYKAGDSLSGSLGIGFNLQAVAQRVAIVTGTLHLGLALSGNVEDVETHTVNGEFDLGVALNRTSLKAGISPAPASLRMGLAAASMKVAAVTGVLHLDLAMPGRDANARRDIAITVDPPVGNWAMAAPVGQWAVGAPGGSGWSASSAGGEWSVGSPTS